MSSVRPKVHAQILSFRFRVSYSKFQITSFRLPDSELSTPSSLIYIILDVHFFDIHNVRASEFQILSFRFRAPEICIHVFEIHNTTLGSSCHLLPNTCDIHSNIFYSKNFRWGSTECNPCSQQSSWLGKITERQRDSLAFNQIKMEDRRCIAGVDVSQTLDRSPATHVFNSGSGGTKPVVVVPTILPNSLIWLMLPPDGVVAAHGDPPSSHANLPEERMLTGAEQMLLQGWPIHANLVNLERHHNVLRDLSGNMFTGTAFLRMMLALLFSAEWDNLLSSNDEAGGEGACSEAVTVLVKRRRTT